MLCRCPLSPLTPGSPTAARVRCFTVDGRLHLFWRAGHSQLRHEAETGSLALRLASLRSGASSGGLLRRPPGQLHGERTTSMISTFQLTRTIRLRLTHQKHAKDAKRTARSRFIPGEPDSARPVTRPAAAARLFASDQNATAPIPSFPCIHVYFRPTLPVSLKKKAEAGKGPEMHVNARVSEQEKRTALGERQRQR